MKLPIDEIRAEADRALENFVPDELAYTMVRHVLALIGEVERLTDREKYDRHSVKRTHDHGTDLESFWEMRNDASEALMFPDVDEGLLIGQNMTLAYHVLALTDEIERAREAGGAIWLGPVPEPEAPKP